MRYFLRKILTFLVPLLLLSWPLDIFLSHNLKKSTKHPAEYEVWNDIYSGKLDTDIAIYGSSRAWVHINPEVLGQGLGKTVYNFGLDGQMFEIQYLRHLEYLKHNPKPETIIISLDDFTLRKREGLYEADQFLPYMFYNDNIREITQKYVGFDPLDYAVPLIRYAGKSKAIETAFQCAIGTCENEPYRKNGFRAMPHKWDETLPNRRASERTYEMDESTIQLFDKFLSDVTQQDIEIIFVYTPVLKEGQRRITNLTEIMDLYREFAQKYNLLFLDYSDHPLNEQFEYFYNFTHLTKEGVEIFNRDLVGDMVRQREEGKSEKVNK